MASILLLSGSPSTSSRTSAVLHIAASRLRVAGHAAHVRELRHLPPDALLSGRSDDPELAAAVAAVRDASALVVGTPIYKAAYSGLLKAFLDLLPERALAGKTVLPIATGGTVAHLLALDYALRPVLTALRPRQVLPGYFILDRTVHRGQSGEVELADDTETGLTEAVAGLDAALAVPARLARAS
jgi:FMN reductase